MDENVRRDAGVKVKPQGQETTMRIGELAGRTGASPRALRHYEERGLLTPERSSGSYRVYSDGDVVRVAQIKAMIDAGLTTAVVKRYIDCARNGDHGPWLEMCPNLRAELTAVEQRLDAQQAQVTATKQRLRALTAAD